MKPAKTITLKKCLALCGDKTKAQAMYKFYRSAKDIKNNLYLSRVNLVVTKHGTDAKCCVTYKSQNGFGFACALLPDIPQYIEVLQNVIYK